MSEELATHDEAEASLYRERAAARVGSLLARQYPQHSDSERVRDILTDLRHFCDALGVDFADEDRIAHDNYKSELAA